MLRIKVAETWIRVPDLVAIRNGVWFASILDQPPLIAIEVLSLDDSLSGLQEKVDEYLAFGTEHIWIFDPGRPEAWWADRGGFQLVEGGELTVRGTLIRVGLAEVFAELDRV